MKRANKRINLQQAVHPYHGNVSQIDGEPISINLTRFQDDHSLRGQAWVGCCDCHLMHLITYEVFQTGDGLWWINERAYRLNDSTVALVSKRKRKGGK